MFVLKLIGKWEDVEVSIFNGEFGGGGELFCIVTPNIYFRNSHHDIIDILFMWINVL